MCVCVCVCVCGVERMVYGNSLVGAYARGIPIIDRSIISRTIGLYL